jgi:hypothetical protein
VNVAANFDGRDYVFGALQDKSRCLHASEVIAVVREERRLGETFRDIGIGAAKAVGQLLS